MRKKLRILNTKLYGFNKSYINPQNPLVLFAPWNLPRQYTFVIIFFEKMKTFQKRRNLFYNISKYIYKFMFRFIKKIAKKL